jgi:hypothetical protein
MTDATSGAGNAYRSGSPKYIPVFSGVRVARSVVFYVFSQGDHTLYHPAEITK